MPRETTYVVTTTFGQFKFLANMAEAAAPIRSLDDDDDEYGDRITPTPYQTADARHSEYEAAALLLRYYGPDYYLDPRDDSDDLDHDAYVRRLIVSVEAEDDDEEE